MLHVVNYLVIEAQIPTKEDLQNNMPIQFPTFNNKSTDVSLVFGNMTPMIEIPSNIILRRLEEGTVLFNYISVCLCICSALLSFIVYRLSFDFLLSTTNQSVQQASIYKNITRAYSIVYVPC